jgi:hypothetical protein
MPTGGTVNTTTKALVAVGVLGLVMSGAWYHAYGALRAMRIAFVEGTVGGMPALLKENQALISEMQAGDYVEKDSGILESYLVKIRRDGVAKHADMKQRLDQLAENNTAIVALIKAYAPHAKTAAFTSEGDKFRNYASAWRDRWNSVMELFMAGGNYAASGMPYPKSFPAAVDAEMAAAK